MQELAKGLVSIIIPCYNASSYIKETINSVLTQTFQNFEILLINDGSTDNSSSIIKTIKDDRIHLVEQENQGVSFSRNKGIAMAKGEFVVFLDADDLLHPSFLEKRIFTLSKSAAIACASNVVLVDGKGNKIEEDKKHFAANKSSQILEFNDGIITCPSSYIFKTEFVQNNNNALLVEYEDSKQIYDSIIQILTNKKLRETLIQNGRKSIEQFKLEIFINKLEQLYV